MTLTKLSYYPTVSEVEAAATRLQEVVYKSPFMHSLTYSDSMQAAIYLKREDLQQVRSYKIRGAFNKMATLTKTQQQCGVVCASAGNHAQGVAFACAYLKVKGTLFMPITTPQQKVAQVRMFGRDWIDIELVGDTFDDAFAKAKTFESNTKATFIHPFDDSRIIEGQATVGLEMIAQAPKPLDYVFVPVGGGGLLSGLSSVFAQLSPLTKIIGVEPAGAPAMKTSLAKGKNHTLAHIDKFVDGAAVQRVGDLNFDICKQFVDEVVTVDEGEVCQTILDMYNQNAMVVEPAGALSIAVLKQFESRLKGKQVGCVISGSNNDITRTAEIKERALIHSKLKHYFIVKFPQRAGALKEFVANVLGPDDDITFFEYSKKTSREQGPAVVGILLKNAVDLSPLIQRMKAASFYGEYLNDKPDLFEFLV